MRQDLFNVSKASWFCFLIILISTLFYGLVLREKPASSGHGVVSDQQTSSLSDPLAIRTTKAQPNIKLRTDERNSVDEKNTADLKHVEVKREVVLMGSQFVFIVDAPKQQALAAITQAADAIKQLEKNLSSWIPKSDVSRLNERAGISAVVVGDDTFELLTIAKDLSDKTYGAFDVTVGAVWDVWPFRNRQQPLPTNDEIEQALALVDAQSIVLNADERTAYLPIKGMKVNLGAIGKGYAAGIAIKKMKALGIERAAVSAGGDIYLMGEKSSGPWVVELEHPRWPGRFLDRFVAGDVAVATSGDAKQYIEKDGKRYSHILDARTGWPVDECQSVSIISQSATQADAYATAVYVMGPVKGLEWVEQQADIEALIVDKNGRVIRSSGWKALTNKAAPTVAQNNNNEV